MIDTMKMTVSTPTLTPRIVSDERSLFVRIVSIAINADSFMSSNRIAAKRHKPGHKKGTRIKRTYDAALSKAQRTHHRAFCVFCAFLWLLLLSHRVTPL